MKGKSLSYSLVGSSVTLERRKYYLKQMFGFPKEMMKNVSKAEIFDKLVLWLQRLIRNALLLTVEGIRIYSPRPLTFKSIHIDESNVLMATRLSYPEFQTHHKRAVQVRLDLMRRRRLKRQESNSESN